MNKILWVDTETTGFSASKNDVVQVAGIVDIDGEVMHTFNYKCRPLNPENIQEAALECNGLTREQLITYPEPDEAICFIFDLLHTYVYGGEPFTFGAHNVPFDWRMLIGLFVKNGYTEEQLLQYFKPKEEAIDTMVMFKAYGKANPDKDIANSKLITATMFFDIEHNPHEAVSDITATRELYNILKDL